MKFGNWTLECTQGFTPAELAEAVADISADVELRFVGGLSRRQPGFVDAAKDAGWIHITLWDPTTTGMILSFERDEASAEGPFSAQVETDVAEGFANDTARRALVGELATRIVHRACEKLDMKVSAFDPKA